MGTLYVVATPIGNLEDITLRAIRVLLEVPVIACEDTRRTGQLVKKIAQDHRAWANPTAKKYISVRDWNEAGVVNEVLRRLEMNDVALVADAGTPLLSDPGFKVVRAAKMAGYTVSPIPGAFAAAAALSVSGLPTNKFLFWGFLPKKWSLEAGVTHVIYESPTRAAATLEKIYSWYPTAQVSVAMELTKIHEAVFNFRFADFREFAQIELPKFKGEVTILVYRPEEQKADAQISAMGGRN